MARRGKRGGRASRQWRKDQPQPQPERQRWARPDRWYYAKPIDVVRRDEFPVAWFVNGREVWEIKRDGSVGSVTEDER